MSHKIIRLLVTILMFLMPLCNLTGTVHAAVSYSNYWLVSYETLLFDTKDGDLGTSQYALDEDSKGYYIHVDKDSNFIHIDSDYKDIEGNTHDLKKLEQVKIIPGKHAYYSEFLTAAGATNLAKEPKTPVKKLAFGSTIRMTTNDITYKHLKDTPDAQQPVRTEIVDTLPPDIPKDSILGTSSIADHNSVGYDAASQSGLVTSVSSYVWNHTCGASATILAFGDGHYGGVTTVTGVTYNGISLTPIRSDIDSLYVGRSSLYFISSPTTGSAKAVSVTYSNTVTYGGGGVASYSGARLNNQPDADNGASGITGSTSVDITTIANNCWVFSIASIYIATRTCDNNVLFDIMSFNTGAGSDTGGPVTPAGLQTMSWTHASSYWAISAASFAPIIAPTVDAGAASSVTTTSAGCGESVIDNGGLDPTSWGTHYGTSPAYGSTITNSANYTSSWIDPIAGLSPATLYHYQGWATNAEGTGTSADATLLTLPAGPTGLTVTSTNSTQAGLIWTNATGGIGTTIYTQVQYDTLGYPTSYASGTTGISWTTGTGGTTTGLTSSTPYYFSAFSLAVNGPLTQYSVAYSSTTGNTTAGTAPNIVTNGFSNIAQMSATLQGNLVSLGSYSSAAIYFDYGLTLSYGSSTSPNIYNLTGVYNQAISGLIPNTLYHFRANAIYGTGTIINGSDVVFITSSITIPSSTINPLPIITPPVNLPDIGIIASISTDGILYPIVSLIDNITGMGVVLIYRVILLLVSLLFFLIVYNFTRHLSFACIAPLLILGYGMAHTAIPWYAWGALLLFSIGLAVNEGRQTQ